MQSLEQAINICKEQEVDLDEVARWSQQENQLEKFNVFIERFNERK